MTGDRLALTPMSSRTTASSSSDGDSAQPWEAQAPQPGHALEEPREQDERPTKQDEEPRKQVTFASGTQFESPTATARKSNKWDPSRSRRHLVYAIKLTEEGFRGWSAAHLSPPPADLEGEALEGQGRPLEEQGIPPEEQWKALKGVMSCLIPWDCSEDFDLPVVKESYVTLARDGDERVPVVPLADNRARARHHRRPPPEEVIAQVAEAMFQPGAVPEWYQVAR
ncbi:uncharacterized protein SCHCODRAFT_02645347 [Schizophyllum commune H4-8]|nr:uncharacterized protein SCHCODRAFT_02645347 [Schizophyllum commune H4-8]KAI5885185.1 hypothetical protein SCHCODRAFT_02645347 [Schizophyllum commune H4-8]